jgi:hypothetical protein
MLWAFKQYPIMTWGATGVSFWFFKNMMIIHHQKTFFKEDDLARVRELHAKPEAQAL